MPEQPSGGLANAAAYASLPRKYSPLMKVKTSPMFAPSVDLSRWASVERAFFRNRKPARFPEQWAGESRKIRWLGDIEPEYTRRSRRGSSRIGPVAEPPSLTGRRRVFPATSSSDPPGRAVPGRWRPAPPWRRARRSPPARAPEFASPGSPQRERREHDDHHGRGAGDDGTGLREALHDRRALVQPGAPGLRHASHQEDLVVHAEPEHGAEDQRGDDGEHGVERRLEAKERRTDTVLEHEHDRPEAGGYREQVEAHGLKRNEHRPEPNEQRRQRTAEHQGDDQRKAAADGVVVIGAQGGQAADAQAGSGEPGDGVGGDGSQLAHEANEVARVGALARDDVEQHGPAIRGHVRAAHVPRQGKEYKPRHRTVGLERREGQCCRNARVPGQEGTEASGGAPSVAAQHILTAGKLQDDADGLRHRPPPHLLQVTERDDRLEAAREPRVTARQPCL